MSKKLGKFLSGFLKFIEIFVKLKVAYSSLSIFQSDHKTLEGGLQEYSDEQSDEYTVTAVLISTQATRD